LRPEPVPSAHDLAKILVDRRIVINSQNPSVGSSNLQAGRRRLSLEPVALCLGRFGLCWSTVHFGMSSDVATRVIQKSNIVARLGWSRQPYGSAFTSERPQKSEPFCGHFRLVSVRASKTTRL